MLTERGNFSFFFGEGGVAEGGVILKFEVGNFSFLWERGWG